MKAITPQKAHQVLLQATMGFRYEDVSNLIKIGSVENWIDEQTELNGSAMVARQEHVRLRHENQNADNAHFSLAYTDILLNTGSLLRNRISYILTQLFVVSNNDPALKPSHHRVAFSKYYDNIAKSCFGRFPDLLKVISTSPVMGQYLTFLNNDFDENISPDENFAREIMQLFTIGPALLNMDGSTVTDSQNRPIPSYTQEDIEEGAKVMTGWQLRNDNWLNPMRAVDTAHNPYTKQVLGHSFPAGATAEEDLDQFIDILCEHQNLAPFIAKFFIQKMVSSNPSSDYVYRVASEFRASQLSMTALIKAILTDAEAGYITQSAGDGLIRDPLIVLSHAFRSLKLTLRPQYEIFPNAYAWHSRRFILDAPSVFYHYQPDESPTDERFIDLAAPEFKLYNWNDIYHYFRAIADLAVSLEEQENQHAYINQTNIEDFYGDVDNPSSIDDLIEELNKVLFSYTMSEEMKLIIGDFLRDANRNNRAPLRALLIQILMSPDFVTQG